MINRPRRTMAKLLGRAGLGLGLLIPLLLAACGRAQVVEKANRATDEATPRATLDALRVTPTPTTVAQLEKADPATHTTTPTAALDAWRTTPTSTPVPAAPMAPDFRLPDLDGEVWTLSQFRGQPVMLYFWATW